MAKLYSIFNDNGCLSATHGITIYRGVIVYWDEDYDKRILQFLDNMSSIDMEQLVAVQETKGFINAIWKDKVPRKYFDGHEISLDNDIWIFNKSISIPGDRSSG